MATVLESVLNRVKPAVAGEPGARPLPRIARWPAWTMLAAAALLSGCSSVHFAYNQAPRLLYWWLDGYVDFDQAQATQVRAQIGSWLQWHRRTQLPEYADLLVRAEHEVTGTVTADQACGWFDNATKQADAAFEEALPRFVVLVQMLKPAQIDNIRRKLERNNEVFRKDYLQTDPVDRRRADLKRTVERSELIYGRFDASQRAQIATALQQSPFDAERWMAERRERQQDMVDTLTRLVDTPTPPAEIAAALRGLKERAEKSPRDDYRAYEESLIRANCKLAAQIHNLTTAAQRQAAQQKLRAWEADLRTLAAEPAA